MELLLDITLHLGSLAAWPGFAGTDARGASATPPEGLRVEMITDPAAFEALGEEHAALERTTAHRTTPFQTHRFLSAWAHRFGGDLPLRVLALRRNDRLVMSLPLVERRTPFGRIAEFAGRPLCQYGDAVASHAVPDEWLRPALMLLKERCGISAVLFHNVRRDAALAPWLRAHARRIGPTGGAPGLSLEGVRQEGLRSTHGSLAKRNRRTMRRLKKFGAVDFATVRGGEQAVSLLHEAIAMKEGWLRERGLAGRAFADPQAIKCLEDLVRDAASGAVVSRLSLDGRPVAIEIGFYNDGHYCAYLGAFCPDMARYGVGKLQIERTIEDLVERGAETYDLLPPGDPYKHDWADHTVAVDDYLVLLTPAGALPAFWRARLPQIAKSVFQRLPLPLRARLRGLAR